MAAAQYLEQAAAYQAGVLDGSIAACQWVRLACARNARDIEASARGDPTFPFVWDGPEAARWCAGVERFPHIKGPKARLLPYDTARGRVWRWQTITLEPWQCWLIGTFFGWRERDRPLRRYRKALILVPRKNAKSTITAAIGNLLLTADGESGAEVYSLATKKDQARIVFGVAREMVRRSPEFRAHFGVEVLADALEVDATASKFEALASDANTLDGLNPSGALVDELHAHRTRDVWDVVETAQGSRDQSVLWGISTAGKNTGGVCFELWGYLQKVLEGHVVDDRFFGVNWTIDEGDDPKLEATHRKANPNYGVSVNPVVIQSACLKAQHTPGAWSGFLTKHLNVWVTAADPWLSMTEWDACAVPGLTLADLAQCVRVVLTVDLAETRDIATIAAVGEAADGALVCVARHFYPEAAVEASPVASIGGWVLDGHLIATPGDVHDYARLEEEIVSICAEVGAVEVGFDRALAIHLMQNLQDRLGPECVIEVPQNTKTFNPAMKTLSARVTAGTFRHSGDPVLRWMASNVAVRRNHLEECYPQKAGGKDSPNKIDGVVALLMGVWRLLLPAASVEIHTSVVG